MSENNKVSLLSIGMVRGLIGMLIAFLAGALLVTIIRLIMGLPAWDWGPAAKAYGFAEPAWVAGGFAGAWIMLRSPTVRRASLLPHGPRLATWES